MCLVVSEGPDDSSPVVWPSQEEVEQMLSMAKSMLEGKQKKKKLVREVAEIQEQGQNQDQENLHLEAMLRMHLKEALERIDSQLTIMPFSVALESSMVQPPILEAFCGIMRLCPDRLIHSCCLLFLCSLCLMHPTSHQEEEESSRPKVSMPEQHMHVHAVEKRKRACSGMESIWSLFLRRIALAR